MTEFQKGNHKQIYKSINNTQQIYDLYQVERSGFLQSSTVMQHEAT
ncbi:hypothetical protein [Paenibacillus andongensis]|nr:hypothetical protein [Paenibacillus andongensis]